MGDRSHLLHYVGSGSGPAGDSEVGFQLQNLYDHFEILLTDTEVSGFVSCPFYFFLSKRTIRLSSNVMFCRLIYGGLLLSLSLFLRNLVLLQVWFPVFYLMNQS